MAESSRSRFRYPGWIAASTVAVATAVMAVIAVVAYLKPPEPGQASPTHAPPEREVGSPQAAPPAPGAGSGTDVSLADLTVVSGGSWLAPLPDELAGEPDYEQAVVIACPSNQTGDQMSELIYETRYRYSTLDAELRPFRDPPDDVLVNLSVFSDPQDRQPGAPLPGDPHLTQLRMGETGTIRGVEIAESYYLRLRVECEKPDGFMILTGTVLHPAT